MNQVLIITLYLIHCLFGLPSLTENEPRHFSVVRSRGLTSKGEQKNKPGTFNDQPSPSSSSAINQVQFPQAYGSEHMPHNKCKCLEFRNGFESNSYSSLFRCLNCSRGLQCRQCNADLLANDVSKGKFCKQCTKEYDNKHLHQECSNFVQPSNNEAINRYEVQCRKQPYKLRQLRCRYCENYTEITNDDHGIYPCTVCRKVPVTPPRGKKYINQICSSKNPQGPVTVPPRAETYINQIRSSKNPPKPVSGRPNTESSNINIDSQALNSECGICNGCGLGGCAIYEWFHEGGDGTNGCLQGVDNFIGGCFQGTGDLIGGCLTECGKILGQCSESVGNDGNGGNDGGY